jgi:phosphodiesterase/alkaline phosphatase D-like protein
MSKLDQKLPDSSPLRRKPITKPTQAETHAGLSRRHFLQMSLAGFAAASFARFGLQPAQAASPGRAALIQGDSLPNGVAAGETTQTSTVLWAHSTTPGTVTFDYATADDFATILGTLTADVTDPAVPVKVEVSDLSPATDYFYRATDAAGSVAIGHLRTAAPLGTYAGLHFGVSGDWRGELAPYPSISNVAEKDLEFFVGLGDTIYADYPSPALESPQAVSLEDYRIKHNEGYSERFGINHWAAIRSSTSFIPTIDDHEVANDFAGGASPSYDPRFEAYDGEFVNETELYKNGLQAFTEYNPLRAEVWNGTDDPLTEGKPRMYRYFTYGSDAAVFVLDNRSFRDAPVAPLSDIDNQLRVFQFLNKAFDAKRTMLGNAQLEAITRDLLQAHQDGISWKLVIMPEPIQNLGVLAAQDRYEGYAHERMGLLKFIADNNITNVVFISADIHGTIVNDLSYQEQPLGDPFPVKSFEITTGSVGFDAPFGPTVLDLGFRLGVFSEEQVATYLEGDAAAREDFMGQVINTQSALLKYPFVGLNQEDEESGLDAELLQGLWTATGTFGWTEFEIDARTQQLHVTTYGIEPYSREDIFADPDGILARTPTIVQEFTVNPEHA